MTVIYAILIFCILIFVHEFGHFIVAKACGVKINEFAIGMGPAFFKKQKGETLYSLRAFPIGGFCAMEGEDEESEEPRAFNNRPAWQRALVLFAGSFNNFLTCVILLIIIAFFVGQPTTTIGSVAPGSPAEQAGILTGDTVIAINNEPVKEWEDVSKIIGDKKLDYVNVDLERDGKEIQIETSLKYDKETNRYLMGISPEVARNPAKSVSLGIKNTGSMTVLMYTTIKQLFTGDVAVSELSGPVGIVYAVNESSKYGLMYVLYLTALLALNLAIINMLPFPALDGGRLLFLAIRQITGKRVTDEMEGRIHFIGIMLLMLLMVYVTFNDVIRFILPIF